MKKITSILSLIFLFGFSVLQAQVATISLSDTTAVEGSAINVPLSTNNDLEDVSSLTFNIKYDAAVLTFNNEIANSQLLTTGNLQVNHTEDGANSIISIGWFSTTPITIQDLILDLKFVYIEGTSPLTFTGTNEVTTAAAIIDVAFDDGSVFLAGQGPLTFSLSDETSDQNQSVAVDLRGMNLNEVGAMQFTVEYDTTALDFVELQNDIVGFTINSDVDGVITLGWFSTDGLSVINSILAQLVFNYTSGNVPVTFDQAACEITKLDQTTLVATYNDGSVAQTTATLSLADVTAHIGDTVNVSFSAKNIVDLGAMTVKINYNATNLSFLGLVNQTAAGNFSANSAGGVLTLGYFNIDGLDVVSDQLVDLQFVYNAGTSNALVFDEADPEVIEVDATPINVAFVDGSVSEDTANVAPVFTAVLGAAEITGGDTLSFTYTATDVNDDTLVFALVSGPEGMTVDSTGVLNWATTLTTAGTFDVVVSVSDGELANLDSSTVLVNDIAVEVTIKQIQTPVDSTDASPYAGQYVRTTGVVTAVDAYGSSKGFFLQDGTGAYSGVFVYDRAEPVVEIGDNVTVTTKVSEYYGLTELDYDHNPVALVVNSTGNSVPSATTITAADMGEEYESVLIRIADATVTNDSLGFGEWEVSDASGSIVVDNELMSFTPEDGAVYHVTGVGYYSYDQYKIAPRDEFDIVVGADVLYTWFEVPAGSEIFLSATDNNQRGMAYNPATGNVLVASRTGDNKIYVLDGITGEYLADLDMGNVNDSSYQYRVNQVVVTDDGVIYACNMVAFSFAANSFVIHRWADEDATPTIAYKGTLTTRNGDAMAVVGTGTSTVIYAGGANSAELRKYTTADGENFVLESTITWANGVHGIAPVSADANSNIWVNKAGQAVTLIDQSGTVLATVPSSVLSLDFSGVDYLAMGDGTQLLAIGASTTADNALKVKVVDVTDLDHPRVTWMGERSTAYNLNNITSGGVVNIAAYEDGFKLYSLVCNNGVGAFGTVEAPPPPFRLRTLTHDTGNLKFQIWNDGTYGASINGTSGLIEWNGQDGLWRGSPLWGRTSVGKVSGSAYLGGSATRYNDLTGVADEFRYGFTEMAEFDQVADYTITDGNNSAGYGLPVNVVSMSKSGLEAVIVWFGFVNNTAESIDDLYGGLFLDFDVDGDTYETNSGGYSEGERLVYVYDSQSPYYYGVSAVYGFDGYLATTSSASDLNDSRTKAFQGISTPDADGPDTNGDIRTFIGSKVDAIAPGDTGWVAFVISAGDELINLRDNISHAITVAKYYFDNSIVVTDVEQEPGIPEDYSLSQNYPNPFNPTTTIKFGLPVASQVKVKVYNLLGETVQVLVDQSMAAGSYNINFNASNLASGVYFYNIEAKSVDGSKDFNIVKKMMLVK
ncbi:MAG: T9SS type A sorting domain-containing protein [Melioribacteraceae bacterium]|nr:T9SS type A sorting domain-containing protein [Melioribacteraceae bacterium]